MDTLGDDDAKLGEQAPYLIGLCSAGFDKALSCPVHGEDGLLFDILDGDKAHIGPGNGFTDGFGIGHVVFVGFDVGFDELRRHEFDGVAVVLKLSCPVVRTAAGFHADQARWQVGEVGEHLGTLQFLARGHLAVFIHTVYLKNSLCQIDASCRNLHFWMPLSLFSDCLSTTTTLAL